MVGYRHDDHMSTNQKLIAGCISGIVMRFVTQPLDVLKVKTQLQKNLGKGKKISLFRMTKSILSEEGITGFWHGHNLGQVHSILTTSTQFYIYELTTKHAQNTSIGKQNKMITEFCCGICSGCCSATVVTPIEVIRIRQILIKEQYGGLYKGAKAVYRSGGLFAFYEGWSAGVLMLGPQMGITFSVFSCLQPVILNFFYQCNGACIHPTANAHKPEHLVLASTIAGAVAGFASKVTTYPLDLAKKRLQIKSHQDNKKFYTPSTSKNLVKCSKLLQCVRDTWKLEGIRGLYRGLEVTIYKAQLTNVVAFTTYEIVCYFIREYEKRK